MKLKMKKNKTDFDFKLSSIKKSLPQIRERIMMLMKK